MEDSIKLTIPNYENYLESVYPFTEQELLIIMRLADVYSKLNYSEKCIQIYKMILRCLDDDYIGGENIIHFKISVLINYANALGKIKKYHEAVEILEKTLKLSIENDYVRMIPIVIYSITVYQIKMYENGNESIDLENVKQMGRNAYFTAAARNDEKVKEQIKESYEKYFNEKIDVFQNVKQKSFTF